MMTRRSLVSAMAVVGTNWAVGGAAAQKRETLPRRPSALALGEDHVVQLLLLLDADANGKISKQKWIDFVSAEFDRLDKDKSGSLDLHELAQSWLMATRHNSTGK